MLAWCQDLLPVCRSVCRKIHSLPDDGQTCLSKTGRPTAGPFRPISTSLDGLQICEYLPKMAQQCDKLSVIRSMKTQSPGHPDGIYQMHTCYSKNEGAPHPEIGSVTRWSGSATSTATGAWSSASAPPAMTKAAPTAVRPATLPGRLGRRLPHRRCAAVPRPACAAAPARRGDA